MADIHAATSTYEAGTNDTATAVTANVTDVLAIHRNGPSSAITQIETILGTGTTLKGSVADLATRLAVALDTDGKLDEFSATTKTNWPIPVAECGTGNVTMTDQQIIRYDSAADKLESTGYTIPASTGVIATIDDTQTFTNKTLTEPNLNIPVIADYTSATHNHFDAAGGGILTGNAGSGTDLTFTSEAIGTGLVNTAATTTLTVVASAKVMLVASAYVRSSNTTAVSSSQCSLAISRNGTNLGSMPMNASGFETTNISVTVTLVDTPPGGSWTYTAAVLSTVSGPSKVTLANVKIAAFTVA